MFGVPLSSVVNTGFPRNDRLFGFDRKTILNQMDIDHSKFVFFWLPTYRKSVIGVIRNDGVDVGNPIVGLAVIVGVGVTVGVGVGVDDGHGTSTTYVYA